MKPLYRRPPTLPARPQLPRNVGGTRQNAAMAELSWASLTTPVGPVSVAASAAGVAQVRYGAPPAQAATDRAATNGASCDLAETAGQQLAEYFSGQRREFDLQLDWSSTKGTQREVLRVLAGSVSYGETIRYGQLARRADLTAIAGTLAAGTLPARTVGQIMGSNPIPVIVPCHRVLASDGLGGYSGGAGIEVKRWLLILEGSLPPTLDWQPMT